MTALKPLCRSIIEPLEGRIAPALLVNGANLLGGDSPSVGETSVGDNSIALVKVLAGRAIVWYDGDHITSISVGPGAKLDIVGGVTGDIIANLTADGALSDSDNNPVNGEDGNVLLPNDIAGIKLTPLSGESATIGRIITGGSISNLEITGRVESVYAGNGAYRPESFASVGGVITSEVSIDVNPVQFGVQPRFELNLSKAIFKGGASISGVSVEVAKNFQIFAGDGSPDGAPATGTGVAGGNVSGIKIVTAAVESGSSLNTPSYHIIAGDGGEGKKGGPGGTINNVFETYSTGQVILHSGSGGKGNAGAGGAGGNISNTDLQSSGSQYNVTTGDGGTGTPGGGAGRLVNANFANRTPLAGVILTADFTGDGKGDVFVADAGSSNAELERNLGGGAFEPVIQNGTSSQIDGAGLVPVDGLALDVDSDGDNDAVLIYRDGTMAAYLNDGTGNFYNIVDGGFNVVSTSLGFTPYRLSSLSPSTFLVAENSDGKGIIHGVSFDVFGGELTSEIYPGTLTYSRPIADVVGKYVGLKDGAIEQVGLGVGASGVTVFSGATIGKVNGGLDDLDVNKDGDRLLAVSNFGKAISLFDLSKTGTPLIGTFSLSGGVGNPISGKFVADGDPNVEDQVVVLKNSLDKAQVTLVKTPDLTDPNSVFSITAQFTSQTLLKNFGVILEANSPVIKVAGLPGPLNKYTVVDSFVSEEDHPLPFASKQVFITTGNGGVGIDFGSKLGAGGNGGGIVNLNIEAQLISIVTGDGGDSANGAAGAGGSISNALPSTITKDEKGNEVVKPGTFKSAGGFDIVPALVATASVTIQVGDGGTPTGAGGKSASGGAGGSISALDIKLDSGKVILSTGVGGNGKGGAGGAGGDFNNMDVVALQGGIEVTTGGGGSANGGTANGGRGGSISGFRFKMDLDKNAEKEEKAYLVSFVTGDGGSSTGGIGGSGGNAAGISLALDGPDRSFDSPLSDPPLIDTHKDTTVTVSITAGDAGDGAKLGGAGGSILNLYSTSIYDQTFRGAAVINYVVMGLFAGAGGNATAGNGGSGGSVVLNRPISGITYFDPDTAGFDPQTPAFIALGGDGGNGSVNGGAGGAVSGITVQNSKFVTEQALTGQHLFSAIVAGGDGGLAGIGTGGEGGNVTNLLLGVSNGYMGVYGGAGGASTNGKGGVGGGVIGSEIGLGSSIGAIFSVGLEVQGGTGGAGKTSGGAGGSLLGMRLNTPQSTDIISALLYAGNGGDANGAGATAGKGGDINGITQAKDYNSSINLIQAGDGGTNTLGKGGAGGNVTNVRTVGFIGRPSDLMGSLGVFDGMSVQGIYSGRGGAGISAASKGVNGAISNIVARQIAAMAAAYDSVNGVFAVASKISNVNTSVIGFDPDADGIFDTTGAPGATPSATRPVDGFILAAALSKVNGTRPAFTFTA